MVCQNEVDIEALQSAGFNAILQPGAEDFGPMPKAGHYIVVANGNVRDIAKDLVSERRVHLGRSPSTTSAATRT